VDDSTPIPVVDRAVRLQVLALQNGTLLAHRTQLWSDAAGRATMYLAVLSGSVVALALAAQATAFGQGFFVFALLLLPVVLYAGLVTVGRITELNNEDFRIVQGLNRVQHGVLELDPASEPYLASSPFDDWQGLSFTFGVDEGVSARAGLIHGLRTLPALFAVINCSVAAILTAIIAIELSLPSAVVIGAGLVVFVAMFVLQLRSGLKSVAVVRRDLVSLFPSPTRTPTDGEPEQPAD